MLRHSFLLWGLFFALGLSACRATGPETVPAAQFRVQMQLPGAQLVDVRTPEEFAQGHLPGAILMDVNAAPFNEQVATLDPARPVLVYCRSGSRSQTALSILRQKGFTHLIELQGGILAWDGPVE